MKKYLKKVFGVCLATAIVFSFMSITSFAAAPNEEKRIYTVEDISYEEYIRLKSEMLGVSYEELIAADMSSNTRALNSVYKKYTETKEYFPNRDFKADIIGLFELRGEGNYYDIVRVDIGSALASGSSYALWTQNATQVKSLSASRAEIFATGKYTVSASPGAGIVGFSFSGSGYWTSGYHDLDATVTVDMLKSCPAY